MYVTKPFLPPLAEFVPYLETIWKSGQLTNNGAFHTELELELARYLGVSHISLFNNGTIALLAALKLFELSGEVITTPYTFVATTHALRWNGITPVFGDIDPSTFNLDPLSVERLITERTTAIMPVHVYGGACDVDAFQALADRYGLKLIYDAAHAFGVRHGGQSVLNYGHASALSFHATKVFHTFEGGALVLNSAEDKARIDQLKNFGFVSETQVDAIGINGKLNEVQAAMGLLHLRYIDEAIAARRHVGQMYCARLSDVSGINLPDICWNSQNYSYFPIIVNDDYSVSRDGLYDALCDQGIMARRYFYPLVTDFEVYQDCMPESSRFPVAADVSARVLCLPIYPEMTEGDVERVVSTIVKLGPDVFVKVSA